MDASETKRLFHHGLETARGGSGIGASRMTMSDASPFDDAVEYPKPVVEYQAKS